MPDPWPVIEILVLITTLVLSVVSTLISINLMVRVRFSWNCEEQGHCFEPRYSDVHSPEVLAMANAESFHSHRMDILENTNRTYQCDICRYCGKRG